MLRVVQVEVSATSRFLFQRNPTDYVCVCVCGTEHDEVGQCIDRSGQTIKESTE